MTSFLFALSAAAAIAVAPLAGSVKTLDGAVLTGVRVVVHQEGRDETTTTDASGAFVIPNVTLPATVEVTAPGFAPIRRVVAASPVEFTLVPASLTASVVVTDDQPGAWRDPQTGATVLVRKDLDALPAATLDEALHVVSGFSLFRRSSSRSANPTTDGVTMRGLSASGSSRGLVLLNGVPFNDGFGGWITWTRLPTLAVDRVEVERGAEGDMFGSDALGGVLRIVTPTGQKPSLAFGAQAGSLGVDGTDISGGGSVRHLVWAFGAASWFQTDGSIPLAPESRGAVDRPSNADWSNAFGRVDVAGGGRHASISAWGGRDARGNGTIQQVNRMSGRTVAASFDALGSTSTFAARVSMSPNTFYQTFTAVSATRATETLTSVQDIDTTTTRAIAEYGRSVPRGRILVGAVLTHATADFQETKTAGTTTQVLRDDSQAVSAQAGFAPAAHVTFSGGVRHEWRAAPTSKDTRDEATVGHLSAAWQPTRLLHLRGSAATSHRWPTLNELVRNFQVGSLLTLANPDLKPERAVSFDGSAAIEKSRWQVSAGVFHTVVKDAIANVTLSSTLRQRRNAGEAHATGAELDGEVKAASRLRFRASATIADAKFLHSLEAPLEGKVLPQVPKVSWSLTTDIRGPRSVDGTLVWHASSSQFDDDRNQFTLAAASQLDLRVTGAVGRAGWFVVVENATNARIEVGRTPLVTIAPPRAVRVGVTWRR